MEDRTTWYLCLSKVPGVDYAGDPVASKKKLPGKGTKPKVRKIEKYTSLSWPTKDGSTSASPAQRHASSAHEDKTTERALARLRETLELPGLPTDYHFAIQGCIGRLWAQRKSEPEYLPELEKLCWLNISLIEAVPTMLATEHNEAGFASMEAYRRLVDLHAREGFIREALAIAERGERFKQGCGVDDLRSRLARMESEGSEHG